MKDFCDSKNNAHGPCHFERSMTLQEIAELYVRCESEFSKVRSVQPVLRPLTFVVPAHQMVASISRFVE